MTTDKNIMPNTLNEYFSNVGSNLARNIPEVRNETVAKYIRGRPLPTLIVYLFLKVRSMKLLILSTF